MDGILHDQYRRIIQESKNQKSEIQNIKTSEHHYNSVFHSNFQT